jgi:ribosomal protein S18 acetylase RimI-like enzyme
MIPAYAAVLAVAFSDSPDLEYYPRLGSGEGCKEIMEDLVKSPAFLTGGTWLVIFNREPAAVIISSREAGKKDGRVEVVAVAPRHRRVRVGSHLVNKALWALRDRHLIEACLRVNRSNRAAVRFFRSLGFQASESREHI